MTTLGLLAAIGAMLAWTIGDYSIDKTTDRVGDWKTIFFIGFAGMLILTPLVWREIPFIFNDPIQLRLLTFLSLVSLFACLLMFEGLKGGKLSIIEPVFGIELPTTIALSIIVGGEHLNWQIYLLSAVVFLGIILAATVRDNRISWHKIILEKGVILAGIGAIGMGLMNFLVGIISRGGSPIVTIWFLHSFLGIASLIYLLFKGEVKNLWKNVRDYKGYILAISIFDNLAWVSFAYAMVILPISIATTIGSGYIALTVILGVTLNKEKIQKHQIIGILLVIAAVISLSYLVEY